MIFEEIMQYIESFELSLINQEHKIWLISNQRVFVYVRMDSRVMLSLKIQTKLLLTGRSCAVSRLKCVFGIGVSDFKCFEICIGTISFQKKSPSTTRRLYLPLLVMICRFSFHIKKRFHRISNTKLWELTVSKLISKITLTNYINNPINLIQIEAFNVIDNNTNYLR